MKVPQEINGDLNGVELRVLNNESSLSTKSKAMVIGRTALKYLKPRAYKDVIKRP